MRHSIPASVAVFSLLLFVAQAQSNGAPPTSPVVGGHPPTVAPFTGAVGLKPPPTNTHTTFSTSTRTTGDDHHRHHDAAVALYPVLVPYVEGSTDNDQTSDAADDNDDSNDQGGPTVFDRRGSGADSYIPPVHYAPPPRPAQNQDQDPDPPAPPSVQTLLVFKDGRHLEVGNYAIVGATLFDLTPGHPRRVQLADLDLPSTQKQNDDRGVSFQLPQLPQAN